MIEVILRFMVKFLEGALNLASSDKAPVKSDGELMKNIIWGKGSDIIGV